MYVRFITPWWRLPRGADCGLFGPAYQLARDPEAGGAARGAVGRDRLVRGEPAGAAALLGQVAPPLAAGRAVLVRRRCARDDRPRIRPRRADRRVRRARLQGRDPPPRHIALPRPVPDRRQAGGGDAGRVALSGSAAVPLRGGGGFDAGRRQRDVGFGGGTAKLPPRVEDRGGRKRRRK